MRIVIAGQTYYPGNNGQAVFTIQLAEGLARAGHEPHVLVANDRFQYALEEINGVRIHKLRALNFRLLHPEANLALLPRIGALLRDISPDIVHIQDHYFLARDVTLAARRLRIPIIGTNHFLPENVLPYLKLVPLTRRAKIAALWALMLWTYNTLAEVTTPTHTAAAILADAGIRVPVTAVSCGVDTHLFRPSAGDGPDSSLRAQTCAAFDLDPQAVRFLYVGRLDREKRVDLLLRGMEILVRAGRTGLQFVIAGQGAAEAELRAQARTLGLEPYTRFLGFVPNDLLPVLYQSAHIFAMPSPEELQSIATLEAMASGLPILAADARALPELVAAGENGLLFTPGSPESAARGMAALLDQRAAWPDMGRVSRERSLSHSINGTIHRYEQIYHRLAGSVQAQARIYAGRREVVSETVEIRTGERFRKA